MPIERKGVEAFAQLDEDARQFFEGRAAIMEYLDRVPREEVERRALVETLKYVALGWVTTHLHSRLSRFLKWAGRNGSREWLFSVA